LKKRQQTRRKPRSTEGEETENGKYGFTAPNEGGKGASEMPGAPIKVEIVGFECGERNSGRNKLLLTVLVGNSVFEEGHRVSAAWLMRRLKGNANRWRKKA
jgi:hypothetical protein